MAVEATQPLAKMATLQTRMGKRARLRQELFDQGLAALAAARPDAPRVCACPICLRGWPSVQPFTLEHVPPKAVGGRSVLLTCRTCNSEAGSELDAYISASASEVAVATGRKPIDARLTFAGETVTTTVRFPPGEIDITCEAKRSNPASVERVFQAFEAAARERRTDLSFDLRFEYRHDPWRESVGWLRVGYLLAFAMLGYNYILQPGLSDVREQIRNPTQKIVPYFVKRVREVSQRACIHFISEPVLFRGLAITVQDRFVLLPGFADAPPLAERISALPPEAWPGTFSGRSGVVPRRPLFMVDFRPGLIRDLLPAARNAGDTSPQQT